VNASWCSYLGNFSVRSPARYATSANISTIEQGWMQTELAKERLKTHTAAHDAVLKHQTALTDTHTGVASKPLS
jgi:hypothetical protein